SPKNNTIDITSTHLFLPSLGDWENFAFVIPSTKFILKGRIFTGKPLRANALHYALDGGLVTAQEQLSHLGATARLRNRDNPFTYKVPGCYFEMRSKVARIDDRPTMTWKMMRNLVLALEQVLEKERKYYETSFVLVDESKVTWGHGQITERAPPKEGG
ncbi:MAG: hypothetical protein Q9224_006901, partial [Gallowayella concinna]